MEAMEYSASEIRKILQQLFPQRRLVLSQFTFYNHCGVAKPTGDTFRRGRRRYRLPDILPIACVLALKEEGIPLKNISLLPTLVQECAEKIVGSGESCKLSGYGEHIHIENGTANTALEAFLLNTDGTHIFWSYDVGLLAKQLKNIIFNQQSEIRQAA